MVKRILVAVAAATILAGCGAPMTLRQTRTGGDMTPTVKTDISGKPDLKAINVGDTVAVSPGNMKAVFASTTLTYELYENSLTTRAELEKSQKDLAINRKDLPKLELLKAEFMNGQVWTRVMINREGEDPKRFDRTVHMIVINRGEKPFRGDLTIYDLMPPELQFISVTDASKLINQQAAKSFLSVLPIIQFVAFSMDDFRPSSEKIPMTHAMIDQMHRYSLPRLVLDPGQAVGFDLNVRYILPTDEELAELRETATPHVQR
jgi:hypothetical protein